MTASLAVAIIGPVLGAVFGGSVFMFKRVATKTDQQLQNIAASVETISLQVTEVQIAMPTNYVSKDDFYRHIAEEDRWQNTVLAQVNTLHNDIVDLRNAQR